MRTHRGPRFRSLLPCALVVAILVAWGCAGQSPAPTQILWDTWGVPHVFAPSDEDLFRGFGHAQMDSHGDLVLRLYGQARGRAAEYWGPAHADGDRQVRTLGVPDRAQEWYRAQRPDMRALLDAFVAGMNAWARAHPGDLTPEVRVVLPVMPTDVLAHLQRVIHLTFVGGEAAERTAGWSAAPGSNAWAIGPARSASGHALLLANPHLPWSDLFTFFEAQLAGPGVDAYGVALVGMPVLGIAFNHHLGWTHTVNVLDGADLYELRRSGDGYAWDSGVRPFEVRVDTLRVRQPDGTLQTEPLPVLQSVHGPVVAQRGARALALRLSGLDQPGFLGQYWEMMRATDLASFEAALAQLQNPFFNVVYADRDGHVLYLFGGRAPRRPGGDWDYWQGIVPGDTSATRWTETLTYGELPRVLDPPGGFVQNANDPPWTCAFPPALDAAAFPPYLTKRGMHLRAQRSTRLLLENSAITLAEAEQYMFATRLELADRLLDELLLAARQQGSAEAGAAAEVLAAWDRATDADSQGAVLFAAWAAGMRGGPLFATAWDAARPLATPSGLADPARAVAVLEQAAAQVRQTYGRLDVPWGEVYRLRRGGRDLPANGGWDGLGAFGATWYAAADSGRFQASGGDSYVALVEFTEPVRARVLLAYGNASQPHSPHCGDQLELYAAQTLRPAWRTRSEVEAHLERRETLTP
ncbi:MAG: acylase [Candidatus Latescibacterota bacterium]